MAEVLLDAGKAHWRYVMELMNLIKARLPLQEPYELIFRNFI